MKLNSLSRILESNEDDPFVESKYPDVKAELAALNAQQDAIDNMTGTMRMRLINMLGTSPSVAVNQITLSGKLLAQGKMLGNDWKRYEFPTALLNQRSARNAFVYTKDERAHKTVQKLLKTWTELTEQYALNQKRLVTVRAKARKLDIQAEQQSAPKTSIPLNQIPKRINFTFSDGRTEEIHIPYWKVLAPTSSATIERYAGPPSHFTRWPLKTRSTYVDLNNCLKQHGLEGITVLYGSTNILSDGRIGSTRFVAVGGGGKVVWKVDESDHTDSLYLHGYPDSIISKNFVKYYSEDGSARNKVLYGTDK